jgi:hypothetical protein
MTIILDGTAGITTPAETTTGNASVGGNLSVTGTVSVGGSTMYPLVSGTAVASTSGTSLDFLSIPAWVKRITVMFSGVSTNGSSYVQVQIGSGSFDTSGYTGSVTILGQGGSGVSTNLSAGFQTENWTYWSASSTRMGMMTLTLVGSNIWTANWVLGATSTAVAANAYGGGVKTLSGTLDRVRITTVNGTDTFDAGTVNLLWE